MIGIIPISSNEERSRIIVFLLRLCMIVSAACAISELAAAFNFEGDDMSFSILTRGLLIAAGLLSILKLITFLLCAIFFIMWLRRAYHNLHKAGSTALRHSEGWAAGAWFVPFLNLSWPLQIVRDTWAETQTVFRKHGEHYERQEDNLTGWWWAAYLISGVVGYIGSVSIQNHQMEAGYAFAAFGDLGYVLAGFILVSIVRRISAMETGMMQRAYEYYNWLNQQQSAQYLQNTSAQNPQPETAGTENPKTETADPANQGPAQENFYRPSDIKPPADPQ